MGQAYDVLDDLYGNGEVIAPPAAEFATLAAQFPPLAGVRSVIRVAIERIADSCGYGVPQLRFENDRRQLLDWAARKGDDGLRDYRAQKNAASIDGLPGLEDGCGAKR